MDTQAIIEKLEKADSSFQARDGQMQMVRFIEQRMASSERMNHSNVCAVEGQTGCGKSLGYLMPTIPAIIRAKKSDNPLKLIISTANVSLQQQLLESELPRFSNTGMTLNYALVAGRGRYFCLDKVNNICSQNTTLDISVKEHRRIESMANEYFDGSWDGLKDKLPERKGVSEDTWQKVAADSLSCTKTACPHFEQCAFYKARKKLQNADILIANHALVFSDIENNRVLPNPEESIYVFDEAHHLPEVVRNRSQGSFGLLHSQSLLGTHNGNFVNQIVMLNATCRDPLELNRNDFERDVKCVYESLRSLYVLMGESYGHEFDAGNKETVELTFNVMDKFIIGLIDEQIVKPLSGILNKIELIIENASASKATENIDQTLLGFTQTKFNQLTNVKEVLLLLNNYNGEAGEIAKWLSLDGRTNEITICVGRVDVSNIFIEQLWRRSRFCILTSATLTALGSFDRFLRKVGLSTSMTPKLQVLSPFDYKTRAQLSISRSIPAPNWRDESQHTQAMYESLFADLQGHQAGLMLFTSKRQMMQFSELLTPEQEQYSLIQYSDTRNNLISRHKERIDNNERSLLIGVQSLSEGLDLPGKYLTFVGVAKIPFVDASCPIGKAEIELHKRRNGNAFYDIILADASAKLTQATGRLLRTIHCGGEIAIYDQRLSTKHYGKTLLNALPSYSITVK